MTQHRFVMQDDGDVILVEPAPKPASNLGSTVDSVPSDEWLVKEAVKQYGSDDVEFDDAVQPQISRSDDGAWVAGWVWVRYPEPEDLCECGRPLNACISFEGDDDEHGDIK